MFQVLTRLSVVCCLLWCMASARAELPTGEQVIEKWKQREQRIKSARIAWSEKHHLERGSDFGFDVRTKTPDGKVFPNEPLDFEITVTAVFDGNKWCISREGEQWYNQAERVVPMSHRYAFDGTRHTHVWDFKEPTDEQYSTANISDEKAARDYFRGIQPLPIGIWARPNLLEFAVSKSWVTDPPIASTADSRPCARITWRNEQQRASFWLDADPNADCLPRHIEWGKRMTFDFDYTQQSMEWVPKSWTRNELSKDRKEIRQSMRCEVTKCEINIPIAASELDSRIPVGTLVTDYTKSNPPSQHIVQTFGNRPITPEERQRSPTYKELRESSPGQAALPQSSSSWQWWYWVAAGVAAVFGILIFRSARGQTR